MRLRWRLYHTLLQLAHPDDLCSFPVSQVRKISGSALTTALFPAYIRFKRRGEILIFAILCFGGIFALLARDRI